MATQCTQGYKTSVSSDALAPKPQRLTDVSNLTRQFR